MYFKILRPFFNYRINYQFIKTLETRVNNYFEMLIKTNDPFLEANVYVSKLQYHHNHFHRNII
jgi:hypothetical protein